MERRKEFGRNSEGSNLERRNLEGIQKQFRKKEGKEGEKERGKGGKEPEPELAVDGRVQREPVQGHSDNALAGLFQPHLSLSEPTLLQGG